MLHADADWGFVRVESFLSAGVKNNPLSKEVLMMMMMLFSSRDSNNSQL
jgi:hypothetical protein